MEGIANFQAIQIMAAKGEKMAKHTEGPWKVYDAPNQTMGGFGGVSVVKDNGKDLTSIAFVHYCPKANAQLISAAPDLLEACKAALAQIESDDSYWDAEGPTARTLRAAIQKAEGK